MFDKAANITKMLIEAALICSVNIVSGESNSGFETVFLFCAAFFYFSSTANRVWNQSFYFIYFKTNFLVIIPWSAFTPTQIVEEAWEFVTPGYMCLANL